MEFLEDDTRRFGLFFFGGFLFILQKKNPAGNPSPGFLMRDVTGIHQSANLFEWLDYL